MIDSTRDTERAERLNEVYRHLFAHYRIGSQKEMAETLGVQRTALSAAFNGNKAYLTKNLFVKICATFPGVFNLNYLLKGEGSLLAMQENEEVAAGQITQQPLLPVNTPDMSSLINAALAAKDDAIESLKRELRTKDDLIQSLRDQLAAKDALIAEQKARLIDYRRLIDSRELENNYPFPIGVADEKHAKKRA